MSGARMKITLLAPAGMIDFLEEEFESIGEGLQQAENADDVGPAPHLHGRPDLAVGKNEQGDHDKQRQRRRSAMSGHLAERPRPAIGQRDAEQMHGTAQVQKQSAPWSIPPPSCWRRITKIRLHSAMVSARARDRVGEVEIARSATRAAATASSVAGFADRIPDRGIRASMHWRFAECRQNAAHRATMAARNASRLS